MELLWLLCLYLEWLAQFYPWLFYSNQGFMIYFHHFWQRSLCLIRFSSFWLYFILDYQSCLIGKWITTFFKISFYFINNSKSTKNCSYNNFKHGILFSFTMYILLPQPNHLYYLIKRINVCILKIQLSKKLVRKSFPTYKLQKFKKKPLKSLLKKVFSFWQ